MKIYDFLEKTSVIVTGGKLYNNQELADKLLYIVNFEKNHKKGFLLISAKNQIIYFIDFNNDIFANKKMKRTQTIKLNEMLEKIKRA